MMAGKNRFQLVAALVLVLGVTGASRASLLASDPNSIPTFTGSQPFSATGGGSTLNVLVDYAVFAPGTFPGPGPISAAFGPDPSGGTDYVYTYVANNDASSNTNMSALLVGLALGSGAHDASENTSLGGQSPAVNAVTPSNFTDLFPGIAPNTSSDIVMFTSPNPPTFNSASIKNGGVSDQEMLPISDARARIAYSPCSRRPCGYGTSQSQGVILIGSPEDHRAG